MICCSPRPRARREKSHEADCNSTQTPATKHPHAAARVRAVFHCAVTTPRDHYGKCAETAGRHQRVAGTAAPGPNTQDLRQGKRRITHPSAVKAPTGRSRRCGPSARANRPHERTVFEEHQFDPRQPARNRLPNVALRFPLRLGGQQHFAHTQDAAIFCNNGLTTTHQLHTHQAQKATSQDVYHNSKHTFPDDIHNEGRTSSCHHAIRNRPDNVSETWRRAGRRL